MKLIDLDTGMEYAPVYIDPCGNLIIITELIDRDIGGEIKDVFVMKPCGIGCRFVKATNNDK